MEKQFWNHGEKARVAELAGVSPQALSDILSGNRDCGRDRAQRLEAATIIVLGTARRVPAAAWAGLEVHPALAGRVGRVGAQ